MASTFFHVGREKRAVNYSFVPSNAFYIKHGWQHVFLAGSLRRLPLRVSGALSEPGPVLHSNLLIHLDSHLLCTGGSEAVTNKIWRTS